MPVKAVLVPATEQPCRMRSVGSLAGLAGQHSAWLAELLPRCSVLLPIPFILDPAAGRIVSTGLLDWGKGEEMGDVAWEGLMQEDFHPVA